MSAFHSCLERLWETNVNLIYLVKEISRQSNVEVVALLMLEVFNQLYLENQEQKAQLNDFKSFVFGQKESSCKVGAGKDEEEES